MAGHCTTMPTGPAELSVRTVEGSLVAETLAVLLKVVQLVEAVVALMCTLRLWPDSSEMGWTARVRVWEPAAPQTEHAAASSPLPLTQVTGGAVAPGRAQEETS